MQAHAQSRADDKWALVVGVSKYADSSLNIGDCADNARKFHEFLTKEANFAPDHCKLMLDGSATRNSVIESLGNKFFPRCVRPNDLLVIYLSGATSRSALDARGVNYFLCSDANKNRIYETGISLQDLTNLTRSRILCKNVVYIFDGEFSNAALKSPSLERLSNVGLGENEKGDVIISSVNLTKNDSNDNSVFLTKLINALKSRGQSTTIAEALIQLNNQGINTSQNALTSDIPVCSSPARPRALSPLFK